MELAKINLKVLAKLQFLYYRYQLPCIYSVVIFQFFPPGSGSMRENECGSGSTVLVFLIVKQIVNTCIIIAAKTYLTFNIFKIVNSR